MSAVWAKNEVTAAKRRCKMLVQKSDGTLAPRGTDFIALGMVFIAGVNAPNYDLAVGTLTNDRRALVVADFTFTAATSDVCTKVAHGLQTGDGPVRLTTTGTLPAGLALATDYWIIWIDADTFYFATSLANAYAGTRVDITTTGTGTHTVSDTASTQRGLDGHFTYQATQAETNHDCPETCVIIDGALYERSSGWGGFTTADMRGATEGFEAICEGARTYGDIHRALASLVLSTPVANFSTGLYVWKSLDGVKTRFSGEISGTQRSNLVIGDLTP